MRQKQPGHLKRCPAFLLWMLSRRIGVMKVIFHSIVILVLVFIDAQKIVQAEEGCHKEILYEGFSGGKYSLIVPVKPISQEKADTLLTYWKGTYDCKGRLVILIKYINPERFHAETNNKEIEVNPEVNSIQTRIYEGDEVAEVIFMDAKGKLSERSHKRKK